MVIKCFSIVKVVIYFKTNIINSSVPYYNILWCNWWINNKRHSSYRDPLHRYFQFEVGSEFYIKKPLYNNNFIFYLICG